MNVFLLISVLVETVIEMTEDNFVLVQALAQTGNPNLSFSKFQFQTKLQT